MPSRFAIAAGPRQRNLPAPDRQPARRRSHVAAEHGDDGLGTAAAQAVEGDDLARANGQGHAGESGPLVPRAVLKPEELSSLRCRSGWRNC